MGYSSIITPSASQIEVSHQTLLGVTNYDLDDLYSPDTALWKSKVLDLASPKYSPNNTYAFDKSRYCNHGTIIGATWKQQPSGVWALSFDGVNDRIEIAAADSLNLTTAFSIELWAYPTSAGDLAIFEKSVAEVNNTQFWLRSGLSTFVFGLDKGGVTQWSSSASYPVNKWYHVVCTYNNVAGVIYANGAPDGGGNLAGPIDGGAGKCFIGILPSLEYDFVGKIAPLVKVYNVALTAAQVAAHFQHKRHLFED